MTTYKYATFTWTINNFRYCWHKNGEAIVSPVFCVKVPEDTKWKILLYPRGVLSEDNCISLFMIRDLECTGFEETEVEYTLDIVDSNGSGVIDRPDSVKFQKGTENGCSRYIHRNLVISKPGKYLPQGSLTIRCKMFRCDGQELVKQEIFARTIIGFEKRFLSWNINDFGTMISDEPSEFFTKGQSKDAKIQVYLSAAENSREEILFGMDLLYPNVKFSIVRVSVLNTQSQEVDSGEYEFWFDSGACKKFPIKHSKGRFRKNEYLYYPNNILTMSFEITFSSGFAFEGLEKAADECNPISEEVIKNYKCISHKDITDCPCALITDLDALSRDPSTCDIKLHTKSKMFPVHSLVLSARSPVFKIMFANEMREKADGCVHISDISDGALSLFLLYLYTDQLLDMKWDIAAQLYEAADKFAVNSLKVKCCVYLKNSVNLGNACKALVFSDLHQERELKDFVQAFMLKHANELFMSEEFNLLMESNTKLALETTLRNWYSD